MDELVTVIVPVYNAVKYLERCAESILSQSYRNLQIILIDDGSTDGSGDICDRYAARDSRVEVIHQANGGLSAARNAGLDRARGEWISFVDSDDYVSPYYIEDMRLAAGDGCDITICQDVRVEDSGDETGAPFTRTVYKEIITARDASIRHFGRDSYIFNLAWGKLYREHLWGNLRYPVGKINEDVFVSHSLLYRAAHIAVTDAKLYAYVQSNDSIMRSEFTLRRLDVLDSWQEGVRFYTEANEPGLAHIARRAYCSRIFDALCICRREIPHEREAIRQLKLRGANAYREAKPIRGYIDCSAAKALAYRLKLLLGRRCIPLYNALFIRGREYI